MNTTLKSSLEHLLRQCCSNGSITVVIDPPMFPMLGIETTMLAPEKAYCLAKKRIKKHGVILNKNPEQLCFTTARSTLFKTCIAYSSAEGVEALITHLLNSADQYTEKEPQVSQAVVEQPTLDEPVAVIKPAHSEFLTYLLK